MYNPETTPLLEKLRKQWVKDLLESEYSKLATGSVNDMLKPQDPNYQPRNGRKEVKMRNFIQRMAAAKFDGEVMAVFIAINALLSGIITTTILLISGNVG